ncbi:hypothetical protein [uncultured Stenotrophomonas sp.]|uniref:hypothetical protein n=1 Tax=uncultured Stenotrophomonas sp. TaxID=165438 RepID=UPI0028D2F094|nr:hypothetical protein [uncultured Stenotrophomonas sp.]
MIRQFLPIVLSRRVLRVLCLLAFAAVVGRAPAADIHITAEFKPDINDPNKREFVNTTPWSGVCLNHMALCISNNWWSIDTKVRGTKQGNRGSLHGPGSFHIGMPPPRQVEVVSEDGHAFIVDLKMIGAALRLRDVAQDGPNSHPASKGAAQGCAISLSNARTNNYSVMRMFNRNDGGDGYQVCTLHWIDSNDYWVEEFDFTYALTTPSPLQMRSGVYTGSTTYRVGGTGEGADFDLGDDVVLDDNSVTVHFSLTVQHAFQLDLPPGSDRAVLAPKGGWTQWSDHGIVPKALEREVPFTLSSSGQFSVSMQCQYPLPDGRCAIRNLTEAAPDAPLDITLTLPGFRDALSGADVVGKTLTTDMLPTVFTADAFVIRRPSQLRFAVTGEAVEEMLEHPGSHYRGDVTVIFDADP